VATPARKLMTERNEAIVRLGRWTASFATLVGPEVLRELARFSQEAGPGAVFTVSCTRDGFTAQTIGPIVGGHVACSPDEILRIAAELE